MALPTVTGTYNSSLNVPLISRNRLEGRQVQAEFNESLACKSYDPLWFLTRQHQFGELKGEDAGSPISATISLAERRSTHYKPDASSTWSAKNEDSPPLEVMVESIGMKFTVNQRAKMGAELLKLVKVASQNSYADVLSNILGDSSLISEPTESVNSSSVSTNFQAIKKHANRKAETLRVLFSKRVPDGWKVYEKLITNPDEFLIHLTGEGVSSNVATQVKDKFIQYIDETYTNGFAEKWNQKKNGYSGKVVAAVNNDENHIYSLNGYNNQKLDWYSLDKEVGMLGSPDFISEDLNRTIATSIPTPARFKGMPVARWWEMEDASIDYANVEAEGNEIVKTMISEFALVYSNDWFTIPFRYHPGVNSKIEAIQVTDVFGEKTVIRKSSHLGINDEGSITRTSRPWDEWSFFGQDAEKFAGDLDGESALQSHYHSNDLYLPEVLPFVQQSEPIEQINLVRDEVDNQVWAVETRLFDEYLGSIDGELNSSRLNKFLNNLLGLNFEQIGTVPLTFELQTESPNNWIPFLPVQLQSESRDYVLVRGKTIKNLGSLQYSNRPSTEILSAGIDPLNLSQEEGGHMILHNEEVPRAGLILEDKYQRTRWYNGKTFVWYGRSKRIGRLVANSPIEFDKLSTQKVDNGQL